MPNRIKRLHPDTMNHQGCGGNSFLFLFVSVFDSQSCPVSDTFCATEKHLLNLNGLQFISSLVVVFFCSTKVFWCMVKQGLTSRLLHG